MHKMNWIFALVLAVGGAVFFSCGDDDDSSKCGDGTCDSGETATSCAADCTTAPVEACNNNQTCEEGENYGNCPGDCNALCSGDADSGFLGGLAGDGSWGEADCGGNAQLTACNGAGAVGAALACGQLGATAEACAALPLGCTWAGDDTGCIATAAATCAGAALAGGDNAQAACEAANCVWVGGATPCMPAQSAENCAAGTAILSRAEQRAVCTAATTKDACTGLDAAASCAWVEFNNTCVYTDTSFECEFADGVCGYSKTGGDIASGAASTCGLGCLAATDQLACTLACMQEEEQLGTDSLSGGCITCYAAVLQCTLDNCLAPCAATAGCDNQCSDQCMADLAACGSCRTEKGCDAVFDCCASGESCPQ